MQIGKILSIVSLLFGAILYIVAVAGVFWPATPPGDIGLVSTTAMFVLFGVFGLLLTREEAAAA